ncbi:hypothetical protein HMPREF9021_02445 [Simonsiella muelleri ATCC 29453]|uniref:Uncharacterized protein n=1 Tax=Simonsiella muelleri ATCC 29453 TaxID=641147 RepID=V9H5D2_9NEIS|nr:hypothetical protein HMPREF9021_02445 [Simonsiella muelleri ATCC 29453]
MLKSLKYQNIHCKRKIGEVMGTNYHITPFSTLSN